MPKTADKKADEPRALLQETAAPDAPPAAEAQKSETQPSADAPTAVETPAEQPVEAGAPPVKIELDPDFRALVNYFTEEESDRDSDVYVQIAELPEDLADENDRFKVPTTPTEVPAVVAAQLLDSPAVRVAE